MLWSSVRVQGAPLADALHLCAVDQSLDELREQVEREVRYANIAIIEGNDASQFGIGAVCARIAEAVLRDERVVMPIASYREEHGATIALPTVVGRAGPGGGRVPNMSEDERAGCERRAATLRDAVASLR